jgi:hypothetical protein
MASKIKVDQIQTGDGTGTIALQNQLSGLTSASMPTGSVLQVKNHTLDPGGLSVTSSSLVETGLSVAITPSSTSSKIWITACMPMAKVPSSTHSIGFAIAKNGTALNDEANTTVGYTASAGTNFFNYNSQAFDSPSTTSSVTYSLMVKRPNGSSAVSVFTDGTPGFLTVMEIAG